MITDETLVAIDDRLRFILFGLECSLNVEFDASEVERLFHDVDEILPEKRYRFYESATVSVTAHVEEHTPETTWLCVAGRRRLQPPLAEIVERSEYQVFRIRRADAELDGY